MELPEECIKEMGAHINESQENTEKVQIRQNVVTIIVRIEKHLKAKRKEDMITVLKEYNDIFAGNHDEMPGIHPFFAIHKLSINPAMRPVRQKMRTLDLEGTETIQWEVDKLLEAGFKREARYHNIE